MIRQLFKPFTWNGSLGRKGYWTIVVLGLAIVFGAFLAFPPRYQGDQFPFLIRLLMALFVLVLVSAVVRRLHDMGRSGWWGLLTVTPFIGMLFVVLFGFPKSKPESRSLFPKRRRYRVGQACLVALMALGLFWSNWERYWIPSESMKPTLLVGDYVLAKPVDPTKLPNHGAVYIYRHPVQGVAFLGRVIGLPGDRVQFLNGQLILNDQKVPTVDVGLFEERFERQGPFAAIPRCGNGPKPESDVCQTKMMQERLPNGRTYSVLDLGQTHVDTTGIFELPQGQLFFVGDHRDNSTDSRLAPSANGVGFVPISNVVAKADRVLFSSAGPSLWNPFDWRPDRFWHKIE